MVRITMPRTPVARRYPGKATIRNTPESLVLELPAYVIGPAGAFLMLWLPVWTVACVAALVAACLRIWKGDLQEGGQLLVWFTFASIAWLVVLRYFLWMLRGKEVVTLTANRLTIWRKGLLFAEPRHYARASIHNLHVGPPPPTDLFGHRYLPIRLVRYGRIVFNADGRDVEFGEDIEADEGAYLVKLLQARLDTYAAAAAK